MKTLKVLVTLLVIGVTGFNRYEVMAISDAACPHPKNTSSEVDDFYKIGSDIFKKYKGTSKKKIELTNDQIKLLCNRVFKTQLTSFKDLTIEYGVPMAQIYKQVKCIPNSGEDRIFKMSLFDYMTQYMTPKLVKFMLKGIIKNNPEFLKVVFFKNETHMYNSTVVVNHSFKLNDRLCEYTRDMMRTYGRDNAAAQGAKEYSDKMINIFRIYKARYGMNIDDNVFPLMKPCDYENLNPLGLEILNIKKKNL